MKRLAQLSSLAIFFLLFLGSRISAQTSQPVLVMWWNVENLFDVRDDPGVNDTEFTPGSDKHWTPNRLEHKLQGITRVIASINHHNGPDLLGMAEVENKGIVERWLHEYMDGFHYNVMYHNSPDQRGIDVALVYRATKFTPVGVHGHRVDLGPGHRPTRDVTVYSLASDGDTLDCILVHWPSRSGGKEQSEPNRIAAAKVTAGAVDSLYRIRKNDDILIMGDFNDEPTDTSVTGFLHAQGMPPDSVAQDSGVPYLYDAMLTINADQSQGTYYYRGHWDTLDQFILGKGLFDQKGFGVPHPEAKVFALSFMKEQSGKYKGAPFRTYVGNKYLGGTSDHFPITLEINHYTTQ